MDTPLCEGGQDGMNSDSAGFAPARLRTAAFASLGQCDSNGLLDRFFLCRRMAGAYRSILLPLIHQCVDIAADDRLAGSFSERHDISPVCRINWSRFPPIVARQLDVPPLQRNALFASRHKAGEITALTRPASPAR